MFHIFTGDLFTSEILLLLFGSFCLMGFVFYFFDALLLCSPGWPQTYDLSALVYQVLGLQVWPPRPDCQSLSSTSMGSMNDADPSLKAFINRPSSPCARCPSEHCIDIRSVNPRNGSVRQALLFPL